MTDNPQPLSGVSVIETGTGVAVAFCGKLLADYGATVIKIEHPRAIDPVRTMPPFAGPAHLSTSAMHLFLNANKQSVALDVADAAGASLFQQLVGSADILTT